MGIYVNPGNSGFAEINDQDYVDKTMLIEQINRTVGKKDKLTCVSRPRRFGKSYAAKMLAAYYDCSCNSHELFADKKIAGTSDYRNHLNKYSVIYLDITAFTADAQMQNRSMRDVPGMIQEAILKDLAECGFQVQNGDSLNNNLLRIVGQPDGKRFVFIIDEWDAVIREAKDDPEAQKKFLTFLRGWFKNGQFTPKVVAAAYMTGILPIKKDGSQSAISEFEEYSMVKPLFFGKYVGFTEDEVHCLCEENGVDFKTMKHWYDGYAFKNVGSVYNPNSVMKSIRYDDFDSYWTETSAAEGLMDYISRGYKDLTRTIAELIGGVAVKVSITGFANDLTTFRGRDDVLTLMIHLGYLAYDSENQTVRIPNEEIKLEFQKAVREVKHEATMKRLEESDQLFLDTIHEKADAVAAQIEKIHLEETAPLHYNREDSLRSVIKLAYYTYRDHYVQFEELPGGEGFADVVYFPHHDSDWPTLVIELKWNKSAQGAIDQILNKKYANVAERFGTDILLVGINYEKNAPSGKRRHTCSIVKYEAK
ncbi:MAG: AAA family ATPase [Dorea sp.]|nr:AAA family ATPase [Dorea sp.]